MSDGSVTIDVGLTLDELKKDLKNLKNIINSSLPSGSKALSGLADGFEKVGNLATSAGKVCSTVTTAVTGVFTAAAAKAKSFIGTYESAMAVFEKKLDGGKEAASQLYNSLLTIAKGSSFAQEEMVTAGQTLVAMGLDADKTSKYVQIATNAIAGMGGSGADIGALTEVFGKMSMQTNVYTDDLNQLAMKGIPVFDILATKYGKTKDEVKEMASKGLLPASETLDTLTEALNCTDESSKYFQYSIAGMAQSLKTGTLTGALDSINSSFRTFALNLLDLDPRTESGQANIKKLQDVVGAFGAILEDVGTKFGFVGGWIKDFLDKLVTVETTVDENGNTITKYGGYLGQLKEKLDSLTPEQLEKIAKAILGIASAGPKLLIAGKIFSTVSSVLNGFNTGIQTLKNVKGGIDKVSTAFKTLKEAGTFVNIATNGLKLLKVAFAALTSPVGLVILAITAVVAIFIVLWNKCEGFRNFWINLWEAIKVGISTAKEFVVEKIEAIGEFFSKIPEKFEEVKQKVSDFINNFISTITSLPTKLQELGQTILTVFQNAWNSVITFFTQGIPNFISSVIEWISELPYKIGYQIGLILGHIVQFGINAWNWITTELPLIIQNIITWFSELPGKIWNFLLDIINKIIEWGINTYNSACEWINNTINSVITFFSELPGKIWTFLTDVISKIQAWGQSAWEKAKTYTSRLVNSVTTFFSELPGKIQTALSDIINKIQTWGTDMVNKGKEAARNLVDTIFNTITELPGKVMDVGRNIVEGLWNGITGAGDWIKNKVGEFAKGILDGMKEALGIHSPSRLFRDEVGKYIALGVGEGFTENIASVYKKMKASVDFETQKISASISASADLKTAQGSGQIIENNNDNGVNVTQNFYDKSASPYEIAKETRNTMRRFAYGI